MAFSSPESPQELDFPPVRVNQSIARLDLHALIMRSNPRRPPQEANSLDGSTYEVLPRGENEVVALEDSVYGTSDDEGHTESLASTDGHTPDDMSNFSDDDDFPEQNNEASQHFQPQPADAFDAHPILSVDDSTLTERRYPAESESITMHEEPSLEHEGVDAWAHIKDFDHSQVSGPVLAPYGCSELRLTVRTAMSDRFLPVEGTFRILHVGNTLDWAENEVNSSIGAALEASPGQSRSIMIRGKVEPYGPVLHIDHCKHITRLDATSKASGVMITLDNGTQIPYGTGRGHHFAADSLPNIVVFWYPSPAVPAPEVEFYPHARQTFEQYQIPCLDIGLDRWYAGAYSTAVASNSKSLRLCVEGRTDHASVFELQDIIPLDFYTFKQLDPTQLNRHLAALSPRSATSSLSNSRVEDKKWNLRSLLHPYAKQTSSPTPRAPLKLLLAFLILTAMVAMYLVSTAYLPGLSHDAAEAIVSPVTTSHATSPPMATPEPVTSKSIQPLPPPIPSPAILTPRDLTVVPPTEKPSQGKRERKIDEKVGGFDIQTTGEHQFVLSPSKDWISRKRKPQLQIQVSRESRAVPIRYVRTIGGIYIVDLEEEYPVGPFNVSIATHSKPLMQQAFEISLGHNKSRLSQLFDQVKNDMINTGQALRNFSSSLPQLLESSILQMEGRWKERVQEAHLADQLKEAKKEAEHQLAVGTAALQQFSEDTWMRLRRATAPVRTSRAALRARNNAFRIRCRFERAVGLSSKTKETKKSRSCKKIGW